MSQPCTVTCMEQHTGEATRLACSRDEGGRLSWRFVSSVNQDWTRRQVAVVEAHQGGPGRCEVYALPSSRTDAVHVSAACDLDAVAVELVGHDIVVSGQGVELARVPTAVCTVDGAGCGERTAQRHATCLCLVCEARFGDGCYEPDCRICCPLSWQQADEPMRYWTVIFELLHGRAAARIDGVEAHNEAEARAEAAYAAFDDFDPRDEDRFWSENVRGCHLIETMAPPD
jgi:hypothetical protein